MKETQAHHKLGLTPIFLICPQHRPGELYTKARNFRSSTAFRNGANISGHWTVQGRGNDVFKWSKSLKAAMLQ